MLPIVIAAVAFLGVLLVGASGYLAVRLIKHYKNLSDAKKETASYEDIHPLVNVAAAPARRTVRIAEDRQIHFDKAVSSEETTDSYHEQQIVENADEELRMESAYACSLRISNMQQNNPLIHLQNETSRATSLEVALTPDKSGQRYWKAKLMSGDNNETAKGPVWAYQIESDMFRIVFVQINMKLILKLAEDSIYIKPQIQDKERGMFRYYWAGQITTHEPMVDPADVKHSLKPLTIFDGHILRSFHIKRVKTCDYHFQLHIAALSKDQRDAVSMISEQVTQSGVSVLTAVTGGGGACSSGDVAWFMEVYTNDADEVHLHMTLIANFTVYLHKLRPNKNIWKRLRELRPELGQEAKDVKLKPEAVYRLSMRGVENRSEKVTRNVLYLGISKDNQFTLKKDEQAISDLFVSVHAAGAGGDAAQAAEKGRSPVLHNTFEGKITGRLRMPKPSSTAAYQLHLRASFSGLSLEAYSQKAVDATADKDRLQLHD